jgi:hypothetical protein
MYRCETTRCEAEVTGFESCSTQPTVWFGSARKPYNDGEAVGRLLGATLTERVMGYLEQYDRAAYGL